LPNRTLSETFVLQDTNVLPARFSLCAIVTAALQKYPNNQKANVANGVCLIYVNLA
jgi:hypothetical protein